MASAAGVTRSLSSEAVSPGGSLVVTLSVDVSGASDYYAIDEVYPSGWEVTDAGSGSTKHTGHWKYVVIENAENTQFTYTLKAPSGEGSYSFSGEYMFGGQGSSSPITGQSSVVVSSAADQSQVTLLPAIGIGIILIAAIAAAAILFQKKFR
jgi:hypothetical protein